VIREVRGHWTLDPEIAFLNHGSFGACPTPVLEEQAALRARMEREPVQFFVNDLPALLEPAREGVATFVGADADDVVFVGNATTGVNAVMRSLTLRENDEILTTDHAYNACRNVLAYVAERSRARVVVASVPFPIAAPDVVVDRILAAVTPRTRVALIDHVTSPTGLVLPVQEIAGELSARGVDVMVDGAHAPGMLELDVNALGVTYYAANFHKWTCAPKGAGFLWVRKDKQREIHPPVISHGFNSLRSRKRYLEEFDWTGTGDPTAWLCVPKAIAFVGSLGGGWERVRAKNRALALSARALLCDALGIAPPAPESMIGSLASMPLPPGNASPGATAAPVDPLQKRLFDVHRIEVPIPAWPEPPHRLLRISAHLYNEEDEYRRLAEALRVELS
jgi:isopenicillin-N epimerase